jgi:ABC-type branched-subunit amino acid transport system ATPase component
VVLENRHLFGELTVRNNLDLAAAHGERHAKEQQKISAAHRKFSVGQVLDLFPFMRGRLDDAVELLSGGEQQMVAIARALLLNPELLILDEPSTGLSPKVVRDIVGVMAALREGGMSILLVEQNVALAAETSERAYVMSLGRVVHEIERGNWGAFIDNDAVLKAYLGGERADAH